MVAKRLPRAGLWGPFSAHFGEPIPRSFLGHFSYVTRTTRGGLGEAPGASNLRDLKDPIIISHASAPPLGGLRIQWASPRPPRLMRSYSEASQLSRSGIGTSKRIRSTSFQSVAICAQDIAALAQDIDTRSFHIHSACLHFQMMSGAPN